MAEIDSIKQLFQNIRDAVQQKLPDIAIGLTLTAKALAERNIKDKGFGVMYSENKIPAWFLHGKELNASGTTFLAKHGVNVDGTQGTPQKKRRKKKGDPDPGSYDTLTNWKEFRAAQGLPVDHVDLSYSNMMWSNMQPTGVEQSGDIIKAPLGATNTEAQNKMNYNRARYGDYIGKALGEKERDIMGVYITDEIGSILKQFLDHE